jgi:large repetitive protein
MVEQMKSEVRPSVLHGAVCGYRGSPAVFRRLGIRLLGVAALTALALGGCSSTILPSQHDNSQTATLAASGSTPASAPSPTGPHGVFTVTGSMAVSHGQASATLLAGGDVLVVGGGEGPAEIYDPRIGTFSPTGAPIVQDIRPLAVMLASDLVFVLNSRDAELFDAASGKFSATGSSAFDRDGGSMALLENGQVLIAGGLVLRAPGVLKAAELYDPATGKFTPTGSMKTGRECFTATTLQDGRVLVAGGDDGSGCSGWDNVFSSAEIYDPQTHKFTPTGSLTTARSGATATLLNNGNVLIAGGVSGDGRLASAELYDPATGKFSATGSMSATRSDDTATLLSDGRVLMVGDGTAELFDPTTGTFSLTGPTRGSIYDHSAVRLADGRVLIVGGAGVVGAGEMAELYWP